MRNLTCNVLVSLASLAGAGGAARASVHFVNQSNVVAVSFSQQDFSDARIDGANSIGSTADAPGDQTNLGWYTYQNPLLNQHVTSSGGVVVAPIQTGPPYAYFVQHPTGAPGSHTYFYTRMQPDGPNFIASTVSGQAQLHIAYTSSPIVEAGDPFSWTLTIPGNWSSLGSGPGQAELISSSADWSIAQDFTYDGTTTTLSLVRMAGATDGPGVSLTLHAVPAPGGILALGSLVVLCRRRRAGRLIG